MDLVDISDYGEIGYKKTHVWTFFKILSYDGDMIYFESISGSVSQAYYYVFGFERKWCRR